MEKKGSNCSSRVAATFSVNRVCTFLRSDSSLSMKHLMPDCVKEASEHTSEWEMMSVPSVLGEAALI